MHKNSSLTNTFHSSGIKSGIFIFGLSYYIHFTKHFTFKQILQEVIIHLLNIILLEKFILKLAGPLWVVQDILDVAILFFLFAN